jgi:hypothetical protein
MGGIIWGLLVWGVKKQNQRFLNSHEYRLESDSMALGLVEQHRPCH